MILDRLWISLPGKVKLRLSRLPLFSKWLKAIWYFPRYIHLGSFHSSFFKAVARRAPYLPTEALNIHVGEKPAFSACEDQNVAGHRILRVKLKKHHSAGVVFYARTGSVALSAVYLPYPHLKPSSYESSSRMCLCISAHRSLRRANTPIQPTRKD